MLSWWSFALNYPNYIHKIILLVKLLFNVNGLNSCPSKFNTIVSVIKDVENAMNFKDMLILDINARTIFLLNGFSSNYIKECSNGYKSIADYEYKVYYEHLNVQLNHVVISFC